MFATIVLKLIESYIPMFNLYKDKANNKVEDESNLNAKKIQNYGFFKNKIIASDKVEEITESIRFRDSVTKTSLITI